MWQLRNIIISFCLNVLLMTTVYANDSTESATSSKVANFNDFPTCNESDAHINDCLHKVFAEMIPRAKNGIPEINVPPIDPLAINKTSYIFSHPIVQGKVAVRNIKIYGLSKVTVENVEYKREGDQVIAAVKSIIPKLFVEGQYKAKLRVNAANISSKGPFNVTLENVDVDIQSIFDLVKRDGHSYMFLKTINFDPVVGNMRFYAEGLLPEPLLNDAIIEFLNQNWRTVYKSLISETRAAWEPELVKLSHAYFSQIPVDAIIRDV